MTEVCIYLDENSKYYGFEASGHSGYARAGKDIVCSSISVLLINLVNSVESLTEGICEYESSEKTGYLKLQVKGYDSEKVQLLFESCILGLKGIEESYPGNLKLTNRRCKP